MLITTFFLHHSDPVDPTLMLWIQEKLDDILGSSSQIILLVVCLAIVAFPVFIIVKAIIHQIQTKSTKT